MSRRVLVVGLRRDDLTAQEAAVYRDRLRELVGHDVVIISGCASLAVVDAPAADDLQLRAEGA